ncbi:AsmA family protein [Taibaiella koreensis]|uniref:AsmA family protein n=1 Tax=Taibaiella koreensis TaxID=1268548 RepID=UPI000E59C505|nr:AsmA family protein [Taibaiella koreensis]
MSANGKERLIARGRTKYKLLPKWAKIIIVSFLILLLLLVIAWFVMAWYINSHKKELLATITTEVSEKIDGNFHIDDMEPALLKGFPNISVRLKGVTLSDSMYRVHHKNMVEMQSVYVKINVLSLLSKHLQVMKVTIADGAIYLFTDKAGYSNTYLFKPKQPAPKKKKGKEVEINNFGIENVTFTFDHFERNKQFKITVKEMDGHITNKGDLMDIETDTKAHFHQLGFNLDKGGFVKNKDLDAPLHILFNKKTKQVKLPKQEIEVDGTDIQFGCEFNFGNKPANYTIDIDAPSIGFKEGTSYLSRHIAAKLDSFDLEKKLAVQVLINGSFQYPDTPLIHARWQATNNVLLSTFGKVEKANLKGEFYNNYVPGKGRGDGNSAVTITTLTGTYAEIPFKADSIVVYGLINPLMKLKLQSRFPVERLDAVIGNTFDFKGGDADINLNYTGPVLSKDTFRHSMYGHIRIRDAALTYIPRSLAFSKCNVNIEFIGNDLLLRNTTLSSARSSVKIDGMARNFMNVYFLDPGKVIFDWNITSNQIDLNEYKTFLAPRKTRKVASRRKQNYKLASISNRLSMLLDKSSMYLHVTIGKLLYNHFNAQQISADVALTNEAIDLKNARLQHAGGAVAADVHLNTSGSNTPFDINAKINNVKIDQLFYAFDNFGQSTLSSKNLEGALSAGVNVRGALTESGTLVKNSMNGKISFVLNNGELNNFPPFESIRKFMFKKRNLSHITFNTLKNDLDVTNGKININPMSIESSALTINIAGVYAFDKGTDISVAIPLRNPQKDRDLIAQGKKPKKDKGIVIYLRARDGDDGKVNIAWDPLKKGLKDSTDVDPDEDVKQE